MNTSKTLTLNTSTKQAAPANHGKISAREQTRTKPDAVAPLSSEEQQEYDRCCDVIKRGPVTAKAIGEALWKMRHRRLYRDTFGNMETFLSVLAGIESEKGMSLIAEWETVTASKRSKASTASQSQPGAEASRQTEADPSLAGTGQSSDPGVVEMNASEKQRDATGSGPDTNRATQGRGSPLVKMETLDDVYRVIKNAYLDPQPPLPELAAGVRQIPRKAQIPSTSNAASLVMLSAPASSHDGVEKARPAIPAIQQEAVDVWVDRIRVQLGKSAQSLVELGQLFISAKSALGHGGWETMFSSGKLCFSLRMAQKLMQVARNAALSKPPNSALLPPSLEALSTLSRLDAEVVQHGIDEGKIRPDMTIIEVKAFVLDQDAGKAVKQPTPFNFDRMLKANVDRFRLALGKVPEDERGEFTKALAQAIRKLAA